MHPYRARILSACARASSATIFIFALGVTSSSGNGGGGHAQFASISPRATSRGATTLGTFTSSDSRAKAAYSPYLEVLPPIFETSPSCRKTSKQRQKLPD